MEIVEAIYDIQWVNGSPDFKGNLATMAFGGYSVMEHVDHNTTGTVKCWIKSDIAEIEDLKNDVPFVKYNYPMWTQDFIFGAEDIGTYCQYGDLLYKVLQAHNAQVDWTPDVSVSLFVHVAPPGTIPEWIQPESTNPFMLGDKVTYNGQTWESTIDNNVWAPGVYGWVVI